MEVYEKLSTDFSDLKTDTIENKFLLFKIGEEIYGIEISIVQEIINVVPITQVPSTPNFIKGIINLRGDILSIVDVRTRFMMEERPYDDLTCIIVVEKYGEKIGIVVDEVHEVKYIRKGNLAPPPSAKLAFQNQFIKSLGHVDEDVVLLVDAEDLLYYE